MLKNFFLSIVFLMICLVAIPKKIEAAALTEDKIEGIRIDQNLKNNSNVHLNNLSLLTSRLYTIIDNEGNYYFCLDEDLYYPSGNDYEFTKQMMDGSVVWLLRNFYTNLEGTVSELPSFRNENFETQYAATQLAIWSFTNSNTYKTENGKKFIADNPIVSDLISVAQTHENDPSQPFEQMLGELNKVSASLTEIESLGEEDGNYVFSSQVVFENLTDSFYIDDTSIDIKLILANETDPEIDLTGQTKIDYNKTTRSVQVKVPSNILDSYSEDRGLSLIVSGKLRSKDEFYLSYKSIGSSIFQPVATRNVLEKSLFDIKSIKIENKTSLTVMKKWSDNNNQDGVRPAEILVQLYGNNQPIGAPISLNESNGWNITWDNLTMNDENGNPIIYTTKETIDVSGYTTTEEKKNDELVLLINTHEPEVVTISGVKTWEDNNDRAGIRPEFIIVHLWADGNQLTSRVVEAKDNWAYSFENLPKYEKGQEITYTITENNVSNYSLEIDGSNLINHYTPGQTSVTVTKFWDDENNQDGKRPNTLKVQLYADEKIVGEPVVLNVENNWQHTWTNLDEEANGKRIKYTAKEIDNIPGYEMTVNDENIGNIIITNSYSPNKIATSSNDMPTSFQNNPKNTTSIPSLGELSTTLYVLLGSIVVIVIVVLLVYKLKRRQV